MLKFMLILFLFIAGYSNQAWGNLQLQIGEGGSCADSSGAIKFNVTGAGESDTIAALAIACHANGEGDKSERFTGTVDLTKDEKTLVVNIAEQQQINFRDHCTATATVGETSALADFKVDSTSPPQPAVTGGAITVGKQFRLENFWVYNVTGIDGVPFFDMLLRECTAANDPWVFWENNNELHRVYPTSTTNENNKMLYYDRDTSNSHGRSPDEADCMAEWDGVVKNIVTIGADHSGCNIKLVKEDVIGGDSFTAQGDPALASDAAVTVSTNVMVKTGAAPSAPSNINNTIKVYISTNRGLSWTHSTAITGWQTAAADSGIAGHHDNTRNMAMIRITDGTDVWWRLIKGQ